MLIVAMILVVACVGVLSAALAHSAAIGDEQLERSMRQWKDEHD
jgi:hypothetical protein